MRHARSVATDMKQVRHETASHDFAQQLGIATLRGTIDLGVARLRQERMQGNQEKGTV
jgi:hypothetical protein